jgi:2-polyprenyl-3-methyl-5-hydroxy-6-metoxy-1,4-benzoquinol methylase
MSADAFPTEAELTSLFLRKYGRPETVGWAPRRRFRSAYYLPSDVYECLVGKLIAPGCAWLDVGGGHDVFPENSALARELVARSARVVAIDPSDNVQRNGFVHERVQSTLEEYRSDERFDLATMRMVVEHVSSPEDFVGALARLVKPGGAAVVFTVNRLSPIVLLSWFLPFRLHHPIKRFFWSGEKEDTFAVHYLMNTRNTLRRLFEGAGFEEAAFARLDDLSAFGRFKWLNYLELLVWRGLKAVGLSYPEHCLLAVYRRRSGP